MYQFLWNITYISPSYHILHSQLKVNGLIELAQAVRDEENRQKEQFIADMKVCMLS
jgi:hypothetical protein